MTVLLFRVDHNGFHVRRSDLEPLGALGVFLFHQSGESERVRAIADQPVAEPFELFRFAGDEPVRVLEAVRVSRAENPAALQIRNEVRAFFEVRNDVRRNRMLCSPSSIIERKISKSSSRETGSSPLVGSSRMNSFA